MGSAIVIGAGPGIGAAVARRFAAEGLPIGLVARKQSTLDTVAAGLPGVAVAGRTADTADEAALRAALDAVIQTVGPPEAVIYNAAVIQPDAPGELSVRGHLDAWAVNVLGALTTAAHVAPMMATGGSVIITGGMPLPDPRYTSLSLGKAGVRTLVSLLDQQYRPAGIHVATVTVAGPVAPGTPFDPTDIANHYWHLHRQPLSQWQQQIVHAG